jgi:hypothetical protein
MSRYPYISAWSKFPDDYYSLFWQLLVFWRSAAAHAPATSVSMFKFQRGNRFAHSEAAAIAAAVAAADSPRHRDRETESPLSPELDSTVLPRGPRERLNL